jgi:aminoglycoside phosphotransferase (APT) family kinase protein
VHPANLVFRDGQAIGLIDFDWAGPGSAAWDFAAAARYWAPLLDDRDIADSRQGRAVDRFRIFLRASGLPRIGRHQAALVSSVDAGNAVLGGDGAALGAGGGGGDRRGRGRR